MGCKGREQPNGLWYVYPGIIMYIKEVINSGKVDFTGVGSTYFSSGIIKRF